jgi:hypothetical protein
MSQYRFSRTLKRLALFWMRIGFAASVRSFQLTTESMEVHIVIMRWILLELQVSLEKTHQDTDSDSS